MGDQCHWLPVREQEVKTGLQAKENKDAGSWEGNSRLPRFQGANIGAELCLGPSFGARPPHRKSRGRLLCSGSPLLPASLTVSPRVEGANSPLGADAQSSGTQVHDVWPQQSAALVALLFLQLYGNDPITVVNRS